MKSKEVNQMCNINVVLNRRKELSILPSMYMNVASYNSAQTNRDGEGMIGYRNKHIEVRKRLKKQVYREHYWLLATHQRLGTSGTVSVENVHPIVSEHFMVMHNGIFSGLGDRERSDTQFYVDQLEKAYTEEGDLLKALSKVHQSVTGSWSVVIYLKGTGRFYYYKNTSSTIKALMSDEWVVLSTSSENIAYAKRFFRMWHNEFEVEPNLLYDLRDGFRVVGKIKVNEYTQRFGKWERSSDGIWTQLDGSSLSRDLPVEYTSEGRPDGWWRKYFQGGDRKW